MSGIAGILHFDGRPVDAELLREMTDAMAHRGPDGAGYWTEGAVGLGHRQFVTTPEQLQERQPHHDTTANLCLTFDGRLDNPEELASDLRGKAIVLREDTDAELVLRAYEAWGEDAPRRFLGDFAFAIWDGARRRLFCARDVMGLRPFHFVHADSCFLFASELQALFREPRVGRQPNEGMIAEHLADQITSHRDTLFRDVARLPRAHCLSIEASGRSRTWKYWEPDLGRRTVFKSDAEYAEAFLELLKAAIRPRLRSRGPIGSELSGGLDSSTVSVLASEMVRSEGAAAGPLETYSMVYPSLPCDESELIRATMELAQLEGHLLGNDELPVGYFASVAAASREFPGYPNSDQQIFNEAKVAGASGCRVILTGLGGNECLEGDFDYLADLLLQSKWLQAWRVAAANADRIGCSPVRLVYRHGVRPLARHVFHRHPREVSVFRWLKPEFIARTGLIDRIRLGRETFPHASVMQKQTCDYLFSGYHAYNFEALDRVCARFGLDYRHPFLDRRLLEFGMSLPGDQRWRVGKPKTVLRNAMATRLPQSVVDRGVQAEFSALFVAALSGAVERSPIGTWAAGAEGWVNLGELERRYNSSIECFHRGDLRAFAGGTQWGYWSAYALSLWAESHGSVAGTRSRTAMHSSLTGDS